MKKSIKKVVDNIKLRRKDSKLTQRKNEYFEDLTDKYNLPVPRYQGKEKFTIISAVYGVEKYLDKFITSIIKQTISFEENIQLILVDDGSLDGSSKICQEWQCRFPNNILHIRKENGGQASARNYGLQHAKHEWVTYIDPDDFVHCEYFESIDSALKKVSPDVAMVSCNLVFFREGTYSFSDSHPLNKKFKSGTRLVKINDELDDIQLSASTALFKRAILKKLDIKFHDIKPDFEDAHFTCRFLLNNYDSHILIVPDAIYYYRKRSDQNSTLDTAWQKDEKYNDLFHTGYFDLIDQAEKRCGYVPQWIQKSLFYATLWYFKYFVNNYNRSSLLGSENTYNLKKNMKLLYDKLDKEYFQVCAVPTQGAYQKMGILKHLYGLELAPPKFYINGFDSNENLIKIKCLSGLKNLDLQVYSSSELTPILYRKTSVQQYFGEDFLYQHVFWIDGSSYGELSILEGGVTIPIQFGGKLNDKLSFDYIRNTCSKRKKVNNKNRVASIYRKLCQTRYYKNKYRDCWIFMDRDNQADDNAEHLYRYVRDNHKKENIYFVLKKSSSDWSRLKNDNFKLLDFGSLEHIMALLNANFLASSHADHYVTNLLNRKLYGDLLKYEYIFLQHGVTKDDLSEWLNNKPIRHLICAAEPEYNSIIDNDSTYVFTPREVALTGFPRHDALKMKAKLTTVKRKVVIMPTWRQNIMGATIGSGNQRHINSEFKKSEYYKKWVSFLSSEKLKDISKKYNYEFVFFPHTNTQPYFKDLDISGVEVISNDDIDSIQSLFCEMAMMITDYSSVAFEMAYLNKPTIYYQFDRKIVFGGGHLTKPGYFDYFKDGFGPICEEESAVLIELEKMLIKNGEPDDVYKKRMLDFFPFRDGKCCQRIYDLMKKSEKKT